MIPRWTLAGPLDAEHHFRQAAGYRAVPRLGPVRRARDTVVDHARRVANRKQDPA